MVKLKFLLYFLLLTFPFYGQDKASEIGIVIDNDLFASTVNDKYYTNGIEVFYRYLNENGNLKVNKKTTEFKIGHYVFNPYTVEAANVRKHDRPFAGYLFGEVGFTKFYQNESVFKIAGQIGVVGPSSQAQEFQNLVHKTFGYKEVEGWNFQIRDALALQGIFFFSKKISGKNPSDKIDFHVQGEANFGSVLNGISVGPLARIALFKLLVPVYDSNLHGASLNSDSKKYQEQREFYFYINPSVKYQIYDATIQGSLFNDNSPVTHDLIPLRFNAEVGFKYRKDNWNFQYLFIYHGKEVNNVRNEGYFYGSIGVSYLL